MNKSIYIGFHGDKQTDIYSLVIDGEIVESVKFNTFNKANRHQDLVGKQIDAMLRKHWVNLIYNDPMSFATIEDEWFAELLQKGNS